MSRLAMDISEYLGRLELTSKRSAKDLVVAYHSACSLQHGQKIVRAPKELLSKIGFVVKDVPEGHLCCGSAGTYNMLEPELARRLRERKVGNIEKLKPDVIAAGNVGCMTQIAAGTAIPVVHTVELIDWATGGPAPAALAGTRASARRERPSRRDCNSSVVEPYRDLSNDREAIMAKKAKKAKSKTKKGKKAKKAAPARKKKRVVAKKSAKKSAAKKAKPKAPKAAPKAAAAPKPAAPKPAAPKKPAAPRPAPTPAPAPPTSMPNYSAPPPSATHHTPSGGGSDGGGNSS